MMLSTTEDNAMTTYTKDFIRSALASNDTWLMRGLVAIYNRQTEDEQSVGVTSHDNGIGFNGVDAFILTSIAQQFVRNGSVSPKQKDIVRKKMLKYAGQLTLIANGKA